MAYVIGDACVSCGACQGQCPVGAISEGDGKFEIDPNTCIDCGSCAKTAFHQTMEGFFFAPKRCSFSFSFRFPFLL